MNTYTFYAVGRAARHTQGLPWFVEDPLFATTLTEARSLSTKNHQQLSIEKWSIQAESPERAIVMVLEVIMGTEDHEGINTEMLHLVKPDDTFCEAELAELQGD